MRLCLLNDRGSFVSKYASIVWLFFDLCRRDRVPLGNSDVTLINASKNILCLVGGWGGGGGGGGGGRGEVRRGKKSQLNFFFKT